MEKHPTRKHVHGKNGLVPISTYKNQETLSKFRVACAQKGKSMSEVLGSLLDSWLKRNEK